MSSEICAIVDPWTKTSALNTFGPSLVHVATVPPLRRYAVDMVGRKGLCDMQEAFVAQLADFYLYTQSRDEGIQ